MITEAENNATQKQDDSSDVSKVKVMFKLLNNLSLNSNESDIPEQVDVTKDTTECKHKQKKKADTTEQA